MDIVSTTPVLDAALHYASLGYKVFPVHGILNGICTCCKQCEKPGKHPATKHGLDDATTDEAQIRKWWGDSPWLNLAIALDGDRLGLDIDPRHDGDKSLAEWETQHGALPPTPCVKTGSGGNHYYLAKSEVITIKNKAGWAPGIDTRSAGGYVLAPPSKHECGGYYEWVVPLSEPIADAPQWLLDIVGETGIATPKQVAESPKADAGDFTLTMDIEPNDLATHPGAEEGKRHHTIMRLLGIHFARGDSIKSIESLGIAWGKRCNPPMPEEHVLTRIRSIEKRRAKAGEGVNSLVRSSFASDNAQEESESSQPHPQPPTPTTSNQAPKQNSLQSLDLDKEYNLSLNKNTLPNELDEDLCMSSEASKEAYCQSESPCPDGKPEALAKGDCLDVVREGFGLESQSDWPVLGKDAYHGLAGAIVRAIAPETEADPAGILLSFLVCVGNAIGRGSHFQVGAKAHYANLYLANVGDTASGKGVSWSVVEYLVRKALAEWLEKAYASGLSSGEGLIESVADDETEAITDASQGFFEFASPEVKHSLIVETEFSRPVTAMRREGNTLSEVLRSAWDGDTLAIMTRSRSNGKKIAKPLKARNAHISIIAHVTPEELAMQMGKNGGVDIANGFANRFLWCCVKRSRLLPDGGDISVLDPFVKPLAEAISFARTIDKVQRSEAAGKLWACEYEALTNAKPGAYGLVVGRGRAQVVRLALIYAILDKSNIVEVEHLRAALAAWAYCEVSAKRLFGGKNSDSMDVQGREASGSGIEPLDLRLFNAIDKAPGITRSGLHEATGNRVKASDMDAALASLESKRLVNKRSLKSDGGGRPSEHWYPGPGTNPDGDDACEKTKELNNSFDGVFTMGSDDGVGSNPHAVAKELTNELTPASEPSPSSLVSSQISFFAEPNDKEESQASQPNPLTSTTSNHDRSQSLSETEFMAMFEPEAITKETTQTESDDQYQMETYVNALALQGLSVADAEQVDKLNPAQRKHAKWAQEYALAMARKKAKARVKPEDQMTAEEFYAMLDAIPVPKSCDITGIPMARPD